ncbi:MAG: AAA family ATPase [Lachnospiraceae bacterium]|nr:AAA family ATPase [Lachnospiraceae bacterium]
MNNDDFYNDDELYDDPENNLIEDEELYGYLEEDDDGGWIDIDEYLEYLDSYDEESGSYPEEDEDEGWIDVDDEESCDYPEEDEDGGWIDVDDEDLCNYFDEEDEDEGWIDVDDFEDSLNFDDLEEIDLDLEDASELEVDEEDDEWGDPGQDFELGDLDSLESFDIVGNTEEISQKPATDQIFRMVGLGSVKEALEEFIALQLECMHNDKLGHFHNHMIFDGNPGTGKTTISQLFAKVMHENGIGNGRAVIKDRAQLIGKYLGQTAPLIKKAFDEASGGILVVDEAGFFINKNNDSGSSFLDEAVTEFVRYMETRNDVTVIFCMYASEVEDFLAINPGLKSRIRRIVNFEDYTLEELCKITVNKLNDSGYNLIGTAAAEALTKALERIRGAKDFGNARAAMNLAEKIIIKVSMRHRRTGIYDSNIQASDIIEAVKSMNIGKVKENTASKKKAFGLVRAC